MQRYIAFLRAINVGGHNVKMDELRKLFEGFGLSNVETFIASGNVIFDAPGKDVQALEAEIEGKLQAALGYPAETFLRSASQLARIAENRPFPDVELAAEGTSLYIAFLKDTPGDQARSALTTFPSDVDSFHVDGREIYWLCRGRLSDSLFSGPLLEKTIKQRATVRNSTTIRKLAARYPAPGK